MLKKQSLYKIVLSGAMLACVCNLAACGSNSSNSDNTIATAATRVINANEEDAVQEAGENAGDVNRKMNSIENNLNENEAETENGGDKKPDGIPDKGSEPPVEIASRDGNETTDEVSNNSGTMDDVNVTIDNIETEQIVDDVNETGKTEQLDEDVDETGSTSANLDSESTTLPFYTYTGDDAIMSAITAFMINDADTQGEYENSISIPAPIIYRTDKPDENHATVYGNFYVFTYTLKGDVLECVSGGEMPGVITVEKSGDSWLVTGVDFARDGNLYSKDIQKFCNGDKELEKQFFMSGEEKDNALREARVNYLADYIKANNLNITAYQDYGWDPVPIG